MPVFALDKENFMTTILQLSGLEDIDFKDILISQEGFT